MYEPSIAHDQVMNVFASLCGQDAARSPFLLGYQSPLCYRCLGIYAAFACAWVVRRSAAPTVKLFLAHLGWAMAGLLVLAGDVFVVQAHLPNNVTRFLTGTGAGWALALVLRDSVRTLTTRNDVIHGERA